jgi:hypothetical protein
MKAIRGELQVMKKAIEFQLSQLEPESRTPAAPPRSAEQQPVKRRLGGSEGAVPAKGEPIDPLSGRVGGDMGTLEQTLEELHEAKKAVEISWLWDGGVDVKAGDEERNFHSVAEVRPWLQHWYGLKPDGKSDPVETELQKIYDSEINITIRTGREGIFVALGNDLSGFVAEKKVTTAAEIVVWLQKAIHERYRRSKYDVERFGGHFHATDDGDPVGRELILVFPGSRNVATQHPLPAATWRWLNVSLSC